MVLNKDDVLFIRDEKGELIPEEISLDNGEIIIAAPLSVGEIDKFKNKNNDDYLDYILLNKLKIPKIEIDDLDFIKLEYLNLITTKILSISGLKVTNDKKVVVENDFSKQLNKVRREKQEQSVDLFLHKQGYNFFSIPKLTYSEINYLIEANNKEVEEVKRNSKVKKR